MLFCQKNSSLWLATTIFSRNFQNQIRYIDAESMNTYLKTLREYARLLFVRECSVFNFNHAD
jgi:hypothetical protein